MNSVRAEHWQDPLLVEILSVIDQVSRQCGVRFCVVGATARDLVLTGVHGIRGASATADVDFAIAVDAWAAYQRFQEELRATGRFETAGEGEVPHLLRYTAGAQYPVDLIPYGGVVDQDGRLAWPPDRSPVMNLIGYPEVVAHALLVELSGIRVRVASLPGLVLLKLFAWGDRWARTRRDVQDVATIMREYQNVESIRSRVFDEAADLMDETGYNLDLASIGLLGRDVRGIASEKTRLARTRRRRPTTCW